MDNFSTNALIIYLKTKLSSLNSNLHSNECSLSEIYRFPWLDLQYLLTSESFYIDSCFSEVPALGDFL